MSSRKKNILYICQYFYPEVFRGNDIAFHWAEEGHNVHVLTGIPNYPNLVKRVKKTVPQKELDIQERQNNLKKAFNISADVVKLNKTILVDDIYTTGSTLDAVALELKRHGVQAVYFIALCIGEGM